MGQGRTKGGRYALAPWPCLDPRRAVTGGLDKGPLFPLSVSLSINPTPRPGNNANKAVPGPRRKA